MGRLDGKVAIITGAAHERGQGAVTARLFVAEGARVVLTDVVDDEGTHRAEDLGPGAAYLHHDVADEAGWREVVAETERRFGRVDVLVNNAGIARTGPVAEHSLDDYMAVVGVNQVGVFLGMKHVIPAMVRAGGGSIVNISSVDGIRGMANCVGYVASKWAVRGMTKTAALEYASRNIRVNSIHPGFIETPILPIPGETARRLFDHAPAGRIGQPEDVAPLSLYLASDESGYCTGAEFVVDGGLTVGVPMPPAVAGL
ncbi:MAG TPA: glucose 1-dehydrogenase [Acidimicrobiales bacterium]|nr:glucose 1-dehydrogenase [Acidimicrobiales bacterium]